MRCLPLISILVFSATSLAAEFPSEHIEFFEKSIRPVLAESCIECHGTQRAEAHLRLDTREGFLKGSVDGKIVSPGKSSSGSLMAAIRHEDGTANMPEEGKKLDDETIAAFARWIELGLPWPSKLEIAADRDLRDHWSLKRLKISEIPEGIHPIDHFIGQKLKAASLTPAPRADDRTLIRRLHYDLTGLPPTFDEAESKLDLPAKLDQLLASPHYGERWARYWLDVARYSDVKGYEAGGRERRFVYSFTYRDWVIHALNDDLPYDAFIRFQLAAEQLTDEKSKRHLAAMGFLTLARAGSRHLVIDDQIDTTFRSFMGLTVSCARCHDHKFDPIPTRDYYSIYNVFDTSAAPAEQPLLREPKNTPEYREYLKGLAEKDKTIKDFLAPRLTELAKKFPNIANRRFQLEAKLDRPAKDELRKHRTERDKFVANSEHTPARALILREGAAKQGFVFVRGNPGQRGEKVEPRFLSAIAGDDAPKFEKGKTRLQLAQEIANRDNPLTARVLVNRVWMHHFGSGIVTTPSDFGHQGEVPSHPEMLDWLANWFMENGWSLKKLHRLILTSETWLQSSQHPNAAKNRLADAENRLLWRANRQRLDFEAMRDSLLTVTGSLDRKMGGRGLKIEDAPFPVRRTVYAFINRQNLPPVFKTFDFASPQAHSPKRAYTTIPTQALFSLNHPFVLQQTRKLIGSPEMRGKKTADDRITALHRQILSRDPMPAELELGKKFVGNQTRELKTDPLRQNKQTATVWQYGYGSFDPETQKSVFTPFPVWTGKQWQPQKDYPIKNSPLSYLGIGPNTGHPGSNPKFATIIRWTAPFDVAVSISGTLEKFTAKSDPIRARVIRNKGELVGEFVCQPGQNVPTNLDRISLNAGDTLDFHVDPFINASHDGYGWAPMIQNLGGRQEVWSHADDFAGPGRLATPWEIYAQALLSTNEFVFVD